MMKKTKNQTSGSGLSYPASWSDAFRLLQVVNIQQGEEDTHLSETEASSNPEADRSVRTTLRVPTIDNDGTHATEGA
jgi:hypothetical protein